MDRRMIQRSIVVLGVIIAAFGFSLHLSVPGTTRSGFNVIVEGSSSAVDHISMELGAADYEFGIEMLPPEQVIAENTTGYLLIETEYERYLSGTPIQDVDALLVFGSGERTSYETSLMMELDLYIIFFNYGHSRISIHYHHIPGIMDKRLCITVPVFRTNINQVYRLIESDTLRDIHPCPIFNKSAVQGDKTVLIRVGIGSQVRLQQGMIPLYFHSQAANFNSLRQRFQPR